MDIKLKNIKIKDYIIYILIAVLTSTTLLSFLEIKDNFRYLMPKSIYTQTEVSDRIYDFTQLVMDYCLYYKSESYAKNKDNITTNDIEICKTEIKNKIEQEYEEFRSSKYNSDNSFNNLSYEQQEKILNEERAKIEEKYNLSDEDLAKYVLERKVNSFNSLSNKLDSYKNLKFAAYDNLNEIWIGEKQNNTRVLEEDSKYLKIIDIDFSGNVIEKIFVNGKEINKNTSRNNYINDYSYNRYEMSQSSVQTTYYDKYGNYNSYENHNITIYVWMPKSVVAGDIIYESLQSVKSYVDKVIVDIGIMAGSIILIIMLISIRKKKEEKNIRFEKIIDKFKGYPIEYKIGVAILLYIFWENSSYGWYYSDYIKRLRFSSIIWCSLILVITYLLIKILIANYNEGTLFSNNVSIKIWKDIREVMKRGTVLKSIIIMAMLYIGAAFLLLFLALLFEFMFPVFFMAGIIMTIVFIILIIKKLIYLDKIMIGARDGAEGKLNYKIEEKGNGHFKELAHNINNIKEGLRKSVENEMKSENMKTELITNVSHDLKTPLTSIINYIELLKREDIQPETAKDYVNVLDKKAQRLKILIEDLFEASKAASGAMELNISKIDINQLLKQALGENDERFKENNLDVKLNIPDEKIFINGDGKRLYRVFENLISNTVKYSLSNTRVYIDMFKGENEVTIVMKNISAYELSFDTNEITNRFKRGDASRTTEGSGLGLAIAKSIVELHGGKFDIEVDGDLFKSIIKLKY